MSVMDMWSICDRCGFQLRRKDLRKETTNFVVCYSCFDGAFDKKNHPQNKSPKMRRELRLIPDARPDQTNYGD